MSKSCPKDAIVVPKLFQFCLKGVPKIAQRSHCCLNVVPVICLKVVPRQSQRCLKGSLIHKANRPPPLNPLSPPGCTFDHFCESHCARLSQILPGTLKKITVKFSKRLQRHLTNIFYPDVLVAHYNYILGNPIILRG